MLTAVDDKFYTCSVRALDWILVLGRPSSFDGDDSSSDDYDGDEDDDSDGSDEDEAEAEADPGPRLIQQFRVMTSGAFALTS